MMSKKEMFAADFEGKNPNIVKQVPLIMSHPELVAATKKITELREKLAALNKDIFRHDKVQTVSQDLIREKKAHEKANQEQTEIIREIETRLVREGLKDLTPIAEKFIKAAIKAFIDVEEALLKQQAWYAYLSKKGYRLNCRPLHWRSIPFEIQLLGNISNYLDHRRKA